jgi:hypothetical protein
VAIRSGENFSAKHFSVIAFLKKLVTLSCQPANQTGRMPNAASFSKRQSDLGQNY